MNERRQTQAATQAGSLFPAISSGDDDGADGPRQRACGQSESSGVPGLASVIPLNPDLGSTSPTVDVLLK
jgi:hypothetical protein